MPGGQFYCPLRFLHDDIYMRLTTLNLHVVHVLEPHEAHDRILISRPYGFDIWDPMLGIESLTTVTVNLTFKGGQSGFDVSKDSFGEQWEVFPEILCEDGWLEGLQRVEMKVYVITPGLGSTSAVASPGDYPQLLMQEIKNTVYPEHLSQLEHLRKRAGKVQFSFSTSVDTVDRHGLWSDTA